MGRILVKAELDNAPMGNRLMKRQAYDCPHFGGACLGDGCINWTPLGSPPGQQNAQCLIERGGEPVHRAECERKAARNEREARHYAEYAVEHNAPRAQVNRAIRRYEARQWRWMAETAPERAWAPTPTASATHPYRCT